MNILASQKQPIGSTIPVEGATGWADTTMMHVNAPNPNCSYKWLNHSINSKLQGDLGAWFGAVPSVPSKCVGSELLGPEGCKINGIENFDKIYFWKTPVASCKTQERCVPYYKWVTDYIAVLGGR